MFLLCLLCTLLAVSGKTSDHPVNPPLLPVQALVLAQALGPPAWVLLVLGQVPLELPA